MTSAEFILNTVVLSTVCLIGIIGNPLVLYSNMVGIFWFGLTQNSESIQELKFLYKLGSKIVATSTQIKSAQYSILQKCYCPIHFMVL